MSRIRSILVRRLSPTSDTDAGVSLVEVVVALMVFSMIAVGVAYSTLTVMKMTDDSRSREVATNLASSELDLARAAEDPFTIVNGSRTVTVGLHTFTVVRSTAWVETSGVDVGCGAGTGVLQAKRVNVTVTWNGMLNTTPPVRVDTLITPDTRINDPALGTIRVGVVLLDGTGAAGVDVTITPTSGGAVLLRQPDDTDTDGCAFALKVMPGTYKVAISRTGWISNTQLAAPFTSVVVTAGGSVAAKFQYDAAATFNTTYATNFAGTPRLPTNLDTSFLSTYGLYVDAGHQAQIALHPYSYFGIAGAYVEPIPVGPGVVATPGCISVDPDAWPAGTVGTVAMADGARTPAVGANPGGTVAMRIPMGVVSVTFPATSNLSARSATPPLGSADPGCGVPMIYNFGSVGAGTTTIALPYGSWSLYPSTNGTGTVIPGTRIVLTPGIQASVSGTVVTFDPRVPK